ncbi:glycoside hydrolase family 127 protein [Mesobacillus foraminis]|uniref:Glycoside hydrolase family 127 protein n=1 Tax=Mesobacillus foraminis TaxID=279826 RepID=A0A4R2B3F7_9BACI|nr:beta-L-arabinofuranosidase domain-containing protein [Mesobacillus foraminis]TCN21157.1 hypothetical protein EV146_11381 [Mesobacillus foraminis]
MKNTISKTMTLPLNNVQINDSFWSYYINLVRDVVVPYQWDALNDRIPNAEPSHAIKNFKIAAGEEQGEYYGMVFQDSDVAKWLEAVGYLLAVERDPELEKIADEVIDIIAKAQREDGYLNTYYTLKEPNNRWTDLCECHELYCAGHMIEGAVAYYRATGKRKILDVVIKLADHIDDVFGSEPGKLQGYDGHQEIELALMKLYEVTYDEKYVKLCQFFLEERGKEPYFYDIEAKKRGGTHHWADDFMIKDKAYSQAHKPINEQEKAIGHAVRFVYMCAGIAHLAAETGNRDMIQTCQRLWRNMVTKQMYITGGIGSQRHGEAFSSDYDLPNDTVYAETCASIGLIFFAQRMMQLEPVRKYADVMERALYNTVLGGMSRDGKSFFYVNPLEVYPKAYENNQNYDHVKPVRQKWFGCACCPPNVARMLASLGQYIYTVQENTVYAQLYISGKAEFEFESNRVILEQNSNYPWDGNINFTVQADRETNFSIALRIPEWCDQAEITVNGERKSLDGIMADGFAILEGSWKTGDEIQLILSMPVQRVKGHPYIRQTAGKVALQRGPLVYCIEEADNGSNLQQVMLPTDGKLEVNSDQNLFGGMQVIIGQAIKQKAENWGEALYKSNPKIETEAVTLKFIPYFSWANRGLGEMQVWVQERETI